MDDLLKHIKAVVHSIDPTARIILFGSQARGEDRVQSDIDILVLLNKDVITREDEKRIKYPLYEIEFEYGKIISPIVLSQKDWESKHSITPFYENVEGEGVEL